jgi:hypothetical protein
MASHSRGEVVRDWFAMLQLQVVMATTGPRLECSASCLGVYIDIVGICAH